MTKREPGLELLLRGGELIATSPLSYDEARRRMLAALRDWVASQRDPRSAYTLRDPNDPGIALIEALAACVEVMGFYHDRILTESKLGAAQRLAHVARLGEFVGYRPSPPLAASARQFFEAVAAGDLPAGTRVGGRGNVVFQTRTAVRVAPAFNRMALLPIVTRQAGALRAAVEALDEERATGPFLAAFAALAERQGRLPPATPSDDFRAGLLALLNGPRGLELCPVEGNRRGGVAFRRPLLRSYDEQSTTVTRATRVRRLRFEQPLGDHDAPLVAFEVSRDPILHLPAPGAPPSPEASTLELFVFDEPPSLDEVAPPDAWDRKAAWVEVPDFSASEASDRHYRTFVDDRLVTYVALRRRLGYRTLLDERALGRVFARYAPAIGRVVEPPPDPPAVEVPPAAPPGEPPALALEGVTMRLDRELFETALVRPKVEERDAANPDVPKRLAVRNAAGWAVTESDLGVNAGEQIVVLGGPSGRIFVRTLTALTSGRYLRWSPADQPPPDGPRPADEHEAVDDVFDPAKAKIAPLEDAARGPLYPLWDDYYKQAREPSRDWVKPTEETRIPDDVYEDPDAEPDTDPEPIEQRVVLYRGSTFLLLGTTSYVKSGDYLLVGRRLKAAYRKVPAARGEAGFDPHAPWLTAEVLQAVEVQGNLVRLRDPVSQDFYEDRKQGGHELVTEVVVVPRVASVYYGDRFAQEVHLTNERTFIAKNPKVESAYIFVALQGAFDRDDVRATLGLDPHGDEPLPPGTYAKDFDKLFLAVSGETLAAQDMRWAFHVDVPKRGLEAGQVAALWLGPALPPGGTRLTKTPDPDVEDRGTFRIKFETAEGAAVAAEHTNDLLLIAKADAADLQWANKVEDIGTLSPGQFRVTAVNTSYFSPESDPAPSQGIAWNFFKDVSGTLLVDRVAAPRLLMRWNAQPFSPQGLWLQGATDPGPGPINVTAIRSAPTLSTSALTQWRADWALPALFDHNADWVSAGAHGTMAFEGTPRVLRFEYNATADRFELPDAPISPGSPPDPLDNATRVWALPEGGEFNVDRSAITAEWVFNLGPLANSPFSSNQNLFLLLGATNVVLCQVNVSTPLGNPELTAKLEGDVRALGAGTVRALLTNAVFGASRKGLWHWTGAALTDPPIHGERVSLSFAPGPVLEDATAWWDDLTLRLIPDKALSASEIDERVVHEVVQWHSQSVLIDSATYNSTTKRTTVKFRLPDTWPQGLEPLGLALRPVEGGHELVKAEEPGPSENDESVWTIVFEGDQANVFKTTMFLAFRDWSDLSSKKVRPVRALIIPNAAQWKLTTGGQGLGIFSTPAALERGPKAVPVPADAKHVAAAALFDDDDFVELVAPSNPLEPFPVGDRAYLSVLSAGVQAPKGKVGLQVPSLAGVVRGEIKFLGVRQGSNWVEHLPEGGLTTPEAGVWGITLNKSASEVFSQPLPNTVPLRLVYDIAATTAERSTGLALRAKILISAQQQAGVVGQAGVNAAVLYNDENDIAQGFVTSFTPGDVDWGFDPNVLPGDVFDLNGAFKLTTIGFGQRFEGLLRESIKVVSLLLEVGPTPISSRVLKFKAGDAITLVGEGDPAPVSSFIDPSPYAVVTEVVKEGQTYALGPRSGGGATPIKALRLRALGVTGSEAEFGSAVDFVAPETPPELWMLSFVNPNNTAILDSLLRYTVGPVFGGGRVSFSFDTDATKGLLPDRDKPLFFYTNQIVQLRKDLYASDTPRSDIDKHNVLKHDAAALLVRDQPTLSLSRPGKLRVLLASKGGLPPANAGATLERGTVEERERRELTVNVYSESIVFNSGNFIPVTGMVAEADEKVIRNALRVEFRVRGGESQLMKYDATLTELVEQIESGELVTNDDPKRLYSFNKVPGGAFTLNFLVIDSGLADDPAIDRPTVTVHVEYGADLKPIPPAPDAPPAAPPSIEGPAEDANIGPAEADKLYAFETWSKELQPREQLVALDSGGLKPDDYLFLYGAADPDAAAPHVEWARITSVIGPVIRVSPELNFKLANFRRYALRGLSKPPRPAGLDKNYYATVARATLHLSPLSNALPLGDRLVLDRVVDRKLLAALVPGDRLLVWDEHHREAWRRHRLGLPEAAEGGAQWFDWPDYQHEAVVKDVDSATGLVVLTEPLPERFAVYFAFAPAPSSPAPADPPRVEPPLVVSLAPGSPSLRVLPHYRAPFQGERSLVVLGSGDKGRRFARYTGVLPASPGLASVPLAKPDTYASNVEVFTRDARSGEWVRWVEFADIDRAKKDPAFVLGLDAQAIEDGGAVPFSVSFGDGKDHGLTLPTGARNVFARTTSVGAWTEHVDRRRGLNVLSVGRFALTDLPFDVPPEATAARENLRLLVEAGDPAQWGLAGKGKWWPELSLETVEQGEEGPVVTAWREVSAEEVCQGYDGVWVRGVSPPLREGDGRPPRPGVVEAFFFRRTPVVAAKVSAWAGPEGRVWALDDAAYRKLVDNDPARVVGAQVLQVLETEGIGPGSLLAFSQEGPEPSPPEVVRVDDVDPDTWVVTLAAPLGRTYALGRSFLRGNLGDVVQGDVKRSFIGSGDGTTRGLRLPLQNRERLLFRQVEGATDPEPAVDVLVDGVAWTRVSDLSDAGPRDRVYRLDVDPDGVGASVVFGDGKHGAVPPPGVNNIEAAFATGDGGTGNLPKGAIDRLVDGNLAVKATSNLVEASGGRPGDTVDEARTKLLGRNVGFDRIVTLDDVARVAREEVGEVLHAGVDPTAPKGTLLLAVALRDRREPTAAMLEGIRQGVAARMPAAAGVDLAVTGAVQVPVYAVVEVGTEAGYRQADVLAALERAFAADAFFAAERWPLAEPLRLGDLYEAIFAVRGVSSARVLWMNESQPPEAPKGPTPERVDPGPRGVIRCDSDAVRDPNRERGSIRFRPKTAEKDTP